MDAECTACRGCRSPSRRCVQQWTSRAGGRVSAWLRGFDRVLSLRAGGMYFPNQSFSGGDDALTARAREPLYLDGVPTPRDAPVFGDSWYATDLWTDFGLRVVDDARKAGKPFFPYLP